MSDKKLQLNELNKLSAAEFAAELGEIFEHAAWVAEAAATKRPFETVAALHDAMLGAVRVAPTERQLAFLRGHPELGGKVARAGAMTSDSIAEQGGLGLNRLSDAEFMQFEKLNSRYNKKFSFPFIICVKRQTRDAILSEFARRTELSRKEELATAINEIGYITRLRLVAKVEGPGAPKTDGRVSTHVLDTTIGKPAAGVHIKLFEVGKVSEAGMSARSLIAETITNSDGRTDVPLMGGGPLRVGVYEIEFAIGDYFRAKGMKVSSPAFLDVVPIRFGVSEPEGHYHVPLVTTPWTYSTYRGS
jgi:2-oxo-4-hydroxy-4-carboxy-5-ureidoimidazoline decarboxylase